MKKALFIITAMIASTLTHGDPMKLVHTKTGFVVVEFKDGKPTFYDRFIEAEMKEAGILVPPAFSQNFGGKQVVFMDDPLFQRAFIEIYYPLCIKDPSYKWL